MRKIAYDVKLKRPGCAILQAGLVQDPSIADLFPTQAWLTSPTTDLHVYEVTDDQLEHLILLTEMNLLPELTNSAVLLLRDHVDGGPFTPESPQDRLDFEQLAKHGYINLFLNGASAAITRAGVARLQVEAEGVIRNLSLRGIAFEVISERLNRVGFKTRDGAAWTPKTVQSFVNRIRRTRRNRSPNHP